jgi:hypothetical protein
MKEKKDAKKKIGREAGSHSGRSTFDFSAVEKPTLASSGFAVD